MFEQAFKRNLKEECGLTEHSTLNAHFLMEYYGIPNKITLTYMQLPWDYITTLEWDNGNSVNLTGFAWGYGGNRPRGLADLLFSLDESKNIEEWMQLIGSLNRKIINYVIFTKRI